MHTVRRYVWLSGLALAVMACDEIPTATGPCPEFCPQGEIVMIDTLLLDVVERDTSFTGYVLANEALSMQVSGASPFQSRGVIRFARFGKTIAIDSVNTGAVVSRDSFRLSVVLLNREEGVSGLEMDIHALPPTVTASTPFDSVQAFFDDSTRLGVLQIPDDLPSDSSTTDTVLVDTLTAVLIPDGFPNFDDEEDGGVAAIGLVLRNADTYVTLGTGEGLESAFLTRYTKADSADGTIVERNDRRIALFDTFYTDAPPPSASGALTVGGVPSARAFLRLNIPSFIIDSSEIITATLLMVPIEPATGIGGDSVSIIANAVGSDFGPKSPIIISPRDTLAKRASLQVGRSDTLSIDFSRIIGQWQDAPSLDHTLVLTTFVEAGSPGVVRLGSSRTPNARPAVRVTYVPPFSFVQKP